MIKSLRNNIRNFLFIDPLRDAEKALKLREKILCGGTQNNLVLKLYKILYNRLMIRYCCNIPISACLGTGYYFPHGLSGIFISEGAIIGDSLVIFQQVTIGSNTLADSKGKGAPIIGDNVYIGAGAKIIGGVHIGNNVRIGADAIVTKDVPDNATVVMEHPRVIIHDNTMDNKFRRLDGTTPPREN